MGDDSPMQAQVAEQARRAVEEADVVAVVIDARAGLTAGDEEIAQILRRSHRPVVVVANKVDDAAHETAALDLHRLGLGEPIPVSALHGRGTGDLLDAIVERLDAVEGGGRPVDDRTDEIAVAILGRPNVGKSSLLNAILGRPRVIVSEVPGTTRDAIDTPFQRGERRFRLIDTAGLRRKRRHRQGVEYYSEVRALAAAERADMALVLIDSSEGLVEGDLAVADEARKAGCATIVVLSKWDIAETTVEDVAERLGGKLRQRPAIVTSSAVTGRNVERPAGRGRGALRPLRLARLDRRAQPGDGRDLGHARAAAPGPPAPEHALCDPVPHPAAAVPHRHQRPQPRHPRLRLLRREPDPPPPGARGRPGRDRFHDQGVIARVHPMVTARAVDHAFDYPRGGRGWSGARSSRSSWARARCGEW